MVNDRSRLSSEEADLEAVLADLHGSAFSAVDSVVSHDLGEVVAVTGAANRRIEDEIGLLVRFRYRAAARNRA
jgi:hypothetical protein